MTVAELIEELKKYPQDMIVASFQSDCPNCGSVEPFDTEEIYEATWYSSKYNSETRRFETINVPVLKIGY